MAKKHKLLTVLLGLAVILIIIFGAFQVHKLSRAHSSFENYYAFRGCTQLLNKTPNSGICKTAGGKTIQIVKYNHGWYLNGDLPLFPFSPAVKILLAALIVWTLIWKGVALWKSARNSHKTWFIVLLIVNTLGILEIIYIFAFSKKSAQPENK